MLGRSPEPPVNNAPVRGRVPAAWLFMYLNALSSLLPGQPTAPSHSPSELLLHTSLQHQPTYLPSFLPSSSFHLPLPLAVHCGLFSVPAWFLLCGRLLSHSSDIPLFTQHLIIAWLLVSTDTEVGVLVSAFCQGKPRSLYHFLCRCMCLWLMIPWNSTSQVFPDTWPVAGA